MPLELFIAGPGFEATRRLVAGEQPLILGRDADCSVCLPDPQRNISRRHLSVWNEGEVLQFLVVSVVNGVDLDGVEVPPAGRGLLQAGQVLALADYRLQVAPEMPAADADPWEEFEREAALLVASAAAPPAAAEDDPFDDWGFQSTFGPAAASGASFTGDAGAASGLAPFLAGLGVAADEAAQFSPRELETIGRLARVAVQGLLRAARAAGGSREALRSEDRTTLEPPQVNPLRMDTPLESKLWYLFGGQAAATGCMPPDRAVGEVVADLLAHQEAMAAAIREAVAGVLQEFDPETLKARLVGGSPKLFESARAWEAYSRDYGEQAQDLQAWVRQLLDRHFASAYAQALLRAKRDSPAN